MTFTFPKFHDFDEAARMGPPMPTDPEAMRIEIVRLRRALIESNERLAKMVEKKELQRQSLVGEIIHFKKLLGVV